MDEHTVVQFLDFEVDGARRTLTVRGVRVPLQPRVFDTLLYLLRNRHRAVTKTELLENVWRTTSITENVVARAVSKLRRVLEDPPAASQLIEALPRIGYRFVGSVNERIVENTARPLDVAVAFQSTEPQENPIALGLCELLISQLQRLPALSVRKESIAGKSLSPEVLLSRHQLSLLVLVQIIGQEVVAMLHAEKASAPLWSRRWSVKDLGSYLFHDEFADSVVRVLSDRFSLGSAAAPLTRPRNDDSYRAYLVGRALLRRKVSPELDQAAAELESALDSDPAFAPAWAALGEAHELLAALGVESDEHWQAARRCARRAIALDDQLACAYRCLASIQWQYEWAWRDANLSFARAVNQFPNHAELHLAYSDFAANLGLVDLSIRQAEAGVALEPVSPWALCMLAQAHHMGRHFDDALRYVEQALGLDPQFPFAMFFKGISLFSKGDRSAALGWLQRVRESGRMDFLAASLACEALAGNAAPAAAAVEQFKAVETGGTPVPPVAFAILLLVLGREGEAEPYLRRMVEARDWHLLLLVNEPMLTAFRELPVVRAACSALQLEPTAEAIPEP